MSQRQREGSRIMRGLFFFFAEITQALFLFLRSIYTFDYEEVLAMKIFKLTKTNTYPYIMRYEDENLYYVWIYGGTDIFNDRLMCTSIWFIAYVVSYIEARKRLKRSGSYYYSVFKGPFLDQIGYWGKNSNGKFDFTKYNK